MAETGDIEAWFCGNIGRCNTLCLESVQLKGFEVGHAVRKVQV